MEIDPNYLEPGYVSWLVVESYPGTTCKSVGGVGTHEVFKGRAEGTTDRRTHEFSSPNFEHGSFGSKAAREEALLNRKGSSVRI